MQQVNILKDYLEKNNLTPLDISKKLDLPKKVIENFLEHKDIKNSSLLLLMQLVPDMFMHPLALYDKMPTLPYAEIEVIGKVSKSQIIPLNISDKRTVIIPKVVIDAFSPAFVVKSVKKPNLAYVFTSNNSIEFENIKKDDEKLDELVSQQFYLQTSNRPYLVTLQSIEPIKFLTMNRHQSITFDKDEKFLFLYPLCMQINLHWYKLMSAKYVERNK